MRHFGIHRPTTELRSTAPLSDADIRRFAPSIFAEAPHSSRSDRYSYIPTIDILTSLRKEGFEPFMVSQCKPRDPDRHGHTKHLVRLRHADQIAANEEVNEIILTNSHDGSSSLNLMAGNFRFACANGLIVGNKTTDVRVPHMGDVAGEVIEGAFRVLTSFEETNEKIASMKAITLSNDEQLAFGRAALELRYEDGEAPIQPVSVIEVRRHDDVGNDLWRVFNRAQEALIRGNQLGRNKATNKRVRTRPINGIDQSVKLNRALWTLAEVMGRLKAA